MDRDETYKFEHTCPRCAAPLVSTVAVSVGTEGGGIQLVVWEEDLEEKKEERCSNQLL